MSQNLLKTLGAIHPLSEELIDDIGKRLYAKEIRKKDFLLREGQVSNEIYFIEYGMIKSFYKKSDKEITTWFMKENDVIISVQSFFKRLPSHEYMQAIENSLLYYISYDDLQYLYATHIEFNIIGRVLTEQYYTLSEERQVSMRRQTAEEKWNFLLQFHPEIITRAALKDIASYLGITLETLSRIRGK